MSNERHSNWSVTINNPTDVDEEHMNLARQKGWKVEGQLEKGENGTPHYQLLVSTGQVRFSAVKKMFPRAHIEPARNVAALREYVKKEQTREGELPTQQDSYPSMDKTWTLLYEQFLVAGVINRYPPTTWTPKGNVRWNHTASNDPLYELDMAAGVLIADGYRVESILANPQNRTAFKKWSEDILTRIYREKLSQTARQTDVNENGLHTSHDQQHTPDALQENNDSSPSIVSQEATLPTSPPSSSEGDDTSSEEGDSSSSRG